MSNKSKNIPPIVFNRNEHGLLEHVSYVFAESGFIDWRKMVGTEFLVPNKLKTQETDVTKIDDKDLLILLAGVRDLAIKRGFVSVSYHDTIAMPGYASTTCKIEWLPNYETGGKTQIFESQADATPETVGGIFRNFLVSIAENRAFVRCVRNYLNIKIVGQDEVIPDANNKEVVPSVSRGSSEIDQLAELMDNKKITFEKLKARLVTENKEGKGQWTAESWESLDDIPKMELFKISARLKRVQN